MQIVRETKLARRERGAVEATFVKKSHAGFIVKGELKPSLTAAKLIEAAGLTLEVGDRLRVTVELLEGAGAT